MVHFFNIHLLYMYSSCTIYSISVGWDGMDGGTCPRYNVATIESESVRRKGFSLYDICGTANNGDDVTRIRHRGRYCTV